MDPLEGYCKAFCKLTLGLEFGEDDETADAVRDELDHYYFGLPPTWNALGPRL